MKTVLFFFSLLICSTSILFSQSINPNYDEALAKRLGADDYGMKSYVLVILKSGENTSGSEAEKNKAFEGHMNNMNTMVKNNKLIVAGPIDKNENEYRGIFILNANSIEEAEKILQTDPAISAKFLAADLYMWYGSAALSEYLDASDKIWKVGI